MPPVEAHDRFRAALRRLLRERGSGSKLALAKYCGYKPSWVSNFLTPRSKSPYISIDDLWQIAGFFTVSVGELLGVPKQDELNGAEQRLLVAFRALSPALQTHILRIAEELTIGIRLQARRDSVPLLRESGHASDVAVAPSLVADHLYVVIEQLAAIAADARRQTPIPRAARPLRPHGDRDRGRPPTGETGA